MTEQTFSGYWWRADVTKDRQPGTLTITSDGSVILELIEGFDLQNYIPMPDGSTAVEDGPSRIAVIHGETTAAKNITLLDGVIRHYSMGFAKPTQQRISARYALTGIHLPNADAEVFQTCQVRIENLRTWAMLGKRKFTHHENGSAKTATVTAQDPVSAHFENFTIEASMHAGMFNYSATKDGADVTSRTTVTLSITSATPRSHRGFQEITMGIVDLLTLASNRACGVISQQLVCEPEEVEIQDLVDGKLVSRIVEETVVAGLFARRTVTAAPDEKEVALHDFLFTCRDMPFKDLVVRWLTLRKKVVRATNMLFSLQYSKPTFIQTQVLVAAVAAEALSRCLHPDAIPMMPRDFDAMTSKVLRALEGIDAADRERFHRLIRNEPTYKDRLIDIAATPTPAIVKRIIPDVETWANELKNVRHGLAHGLEDRGQNANLFLLLQRTQYLIYLVLMKELGLPEAVQQRAVEANQYLMYLYKEKND